MARKDSTVTIQLFTESLGTLIPSLGAEANQKTLHQAE